MAPDPQSGTTPVRLRHRSLFLPTWRNWETREVESLVSFARWWFDLTRRHLQRTGDMRVVPRPVCKTGARPSTGGPIPPSPTAFVDCLRSSIGQSKRLLPVRFQVQVLAGHYSASPFGVALQHAWPSSRRPSVRIRHGRPHLPAWRNGTRTTPKNVTRFGALQVRILPPAPSRRSSAPARALTWYVRGRAFFSRRRLRSSEPSGRGEIGSRGRLKSGRVRRARARSSRAARTVPRRSGSGVSRQRAGLPSGWCGIVAASQSMAHVEERRRCISQRRFDSGFRLRLSAPLPRLVASASASSGNGRSAVPLLRALA
jgi:hypothetical protein